MNTQDGGVDVIDLNPDQWEFVPGKYDVAVCELSLNHSVHRVSSISTSLFLREHDHGKIGVGDDVFMLGLFVDHNGETTNVPGARFGNISMMPSERAKITQSTGYDGVSYVIDMHSRTGFSGSPVFVYRTFGSDLRMGADEFEIVPEGNSGGRKPSWHKASDSRITKIKYSPLFEFLGIHWAQFPESLEVRRENLVQVRRASHMEGTREYLEGMSGMTCAIPSWQVLEALDTRKLKSRREDEHKRLMAQRKSGPKTESAVGDSENAAPPSTDVNPT